MLPGPQAIAIGEPCAGVNMEGDAFCAVHAMIKRYEIQKGNRRYLDIVIFFFFYKLNGFRVIVAEGFDEEGVMLDET